MLCRATSAIVEGEEVVVNYLELATGLNREYRLACLATTYG